MPVLVACGQATDRDKSGQGMVPPELMAKACKAAAQDAGVKGLLESIGHLAATGLTVDADQVKTPISKGYKNLPKTVANHLGINPREFAYAATGGNTPQYLVNHFAEQISLGNAETVMLVGGETLATMLAKFDRWYKWLLPKSEWRDDPGGRPSALGDSRPACTKHEGKHGLDLPANVYPLFENALQHHYGRSVEQNRQKIGDLFAGFTDVAAQNPYAWFQTPRTATELIEPSATNRMVAFPYTKNLNSMIGVNQAAAVVLTSVAKARSLGIPRDRWVFLHGCADAHDKWNLSERVNFHSSPAMRRCGEQALGMADKRIEDINHFDIYSCFPSAVQIACDEFGIEADASTKLTQTGGLPYFGGPGNNYSMHGIAELMQSLRSNPGEFGLLNANGWYLTKHSVGVYSTQELAKPWVRRDPQSYQTEVLAEPAPEFTQTPEGSATIETFTVLFDRTRKPKRGIVFGRLESGERFVANTPNDEATLNALCDGNAIGQQGSVRQKRGLNILDLG